MIVNIAPAAATQVAFANLPPGARTHDPTSSLKVSTWQDAVTLDTIPPRPPLEVHEAIGVAAQSYMKLFASGRALGFGIDATTGKVVITVRDTQGKLLWTAPPSKALEAAAGAALD